jgi:hypothetical protein
MPVFGLVGAGPVSGSLPTIEPLILIVEDEPFIRGKFMTYYGEPHAFGDDEIALAVTIARQLGFAIERLQAEDAKELFNELRDSLEKE